MTASRSESIHACRSGVCIGALSPRAGRPPRARPWVDDVVARASPARAQAIDCGAQRLAALRDAWLNPPE
ncbi:MAG: hypothetical protein KIS84_13555, partial [Dokdonella sp.]|nr:hypothetical protein [Dokdonella sp.]